MMKVKVLLCIIIVFVSIGAVGGALYSKNMADDITVEENTAIEGFDAKITTNAVSNTNTTDENLFNDIMEYSMFDLSDGEVKETLNSAEFSEGIFNVIQLDDSWKYEFHVFKGSEYQNSLYLEHQYGYDPNPRLEEFNSHIWLRVDELIAKGTGLLEKDEVWYDISLKSMPEILRFTKTSIYASENYPMNQEYDAEILSTDKIGNKISLIINSVLSISDPTTDKVMISVEKQNKYTLDDGEDSFIKEFFPKNDLIYNTEIPNLDFINKYKEFLNELLNSNDNEKRLWAINILELNQGALENIAKLRSDEE